MANKNVKKANNNEANSYKHGNLMLISTTVAICTLLVLMLLSTAFKSSVNSLMMARSVSGVISGVFLAAFVVLGVFAHKKDKSLWEYSVYSLIMSVGFLSLLGVPFFLPATNLVTMLFTTRNAQAGIVLVNVIYLVGTLTYHTIKSKDK
ncbi:MAG: hypothetical protein IJ365_05755 [Clostridia bacterium]|nr:hypothetical protein [Clostridia bacterium]